MVLTLWAVAMAAGMRHEFLMRAFAAFDSHLQARLRTAAFHCRQCASVVRRKSAPVLRQKVSLEGVNDASQPDHLTFPQSMEKLSIRPLIRSMA